ncbi:MAG: O-antigen ligase family protein [Cyanomargarita calcarea GSE-NOS-MK-12-04C]|jgi:O-antigen ligase|uniref:O-antigen ligase family protein n=1 Tax=Cyanomargarita calcarea GSE-NOS-MK-12-04C TaxID=2839659 RepID=A0A951QSS3_9CYAN|nr:O-antigen ligase family protein [Cyanomargarita calcarea GSE-NOS-MK-12-04C]
MKKLLELAELGFTVISLLLYSGGPLTVILSGGASEGEEGEEASEGGDSSLILIFFLVNYIITSVLLALRWKKAIFVLKKNNWITALVALAVISVFWSYIPNKTISRGIAIVGTTLFGLYLASRYSMKEQLQLFGLMYWLAVVLSFVFIGALPKYGIMSGLHEGKWRGIYNHKNTLGKIISPGIIIFLLLAIGSTKKRWLFWLGFLLSLILLLRSTSTGSLLNTVMLLVAYLCYRVFRWRDDWLIPGLISVVTIGGSLYLFLSTNSELLLTALGKDTTLTGRGDMWPYIFEMIWKNPLLGYGYGAFWSGPGTPSFHIWQVTGWKPPNSHNGFLDIWLHLGLLGLCLFLFEFIVITLPKALNWVRLSRTSEGLWPILYITYMLLANLSESTLMIQNDLFWVFYVAIAFSVQMLPEYSRKAII